MYIIQTLTNTYSYNSNGRQYLFSVGVDSGYHGHMYKKNTSWNLFHTECLIIWSENEKLPTGWRNNTELPTPIDEPNF